MKHERRSFTLLCLNAGVLLLLGGSACRKKLGRADVLGALVRDIALADTQKLAGASARLESALASFESAPSAVTLKAARASWHAALLAWKRGQCFRFGPLVETNALLRATYWPTRPALIEAALAGTAELDEHFVNELGVDGRGLFGLEYLLFPLEVDDQATLSRLSGPGARRRRRLATALGQNVSSYASTAANRFADGTAFARNFSENSSENLNALIGELVASLENLAVQRLALPLELATSGMLKAANIEGWPSGTSHDIALTLLLGSERIFRGGPGGGLLDLARATAPAIASRIEERFSNAIAKLRAVGMPLERAARENRVALGQAASAAKALEIALKVDLVAALGVTITFASTDGD